MGHCAQNNNDVFERPRESRRETEKKMNDSIVIIALITAFVTFRSLPRESSRGRRSKSVFKRPLRRNNIYTTACECYAASSYVYNARKYLDICSGLVVTVNFIALYRKR